MPCLIDAKLVGVFGLSAAIRGSTPSSARCTTCLMIIIWLFSAGIHPNEIKPHQTIDPNVTSLFEAGFVDTNVAERIRAVPSPGTPTVSVAVDSSMRDLLIHHPKDLSERIHFLGATSDADFVDRHGDLRRRGVSPISKSVSPPQGRFPKRSNLAAG